MNINPLEYQPSGVCDFDKIDNRQIIYVDKKFERFFPQPFKRTYHNDVKNDNIKNVISNIINNLESNIFY
jgi:ABC-type transporter lipoprotein component MlaA